MNRNTVTLWENLYILIIELVSKLSDEWYQYIAANYILNQRFIVCMCRCGNRYNNKYDGYKCIKASCQCCDQCRAFCYRFCSWPRHFRYVVWSHVYMYTHLPHVYLSILNLSEAFERRWKVEKKKRNITETTQLHAKRLFMYVYIITELFFFFFFNASHLFNNFILYIYLFFISYFYFENFQSISWVILSFH